MGAEKTTITMTWGEMIAGIALLIVGAWAVAGATLILTFGAMREDITVIRKAVENVKAEAGAAPRPDPAEAELRAEIARLSAEVNTTNARLGDLLLATPGPDAGVQALNSKLSRSIARQQEFERWVITRLGPSPQPTRMPEGWYEPQVDIINGIKADHEPLTDWLKASDAGR